MQGRTIRLLYWLYLVIYGTFIRVKKSVAGHLQSFLSAMFILIFLKGKYSKHIILLEDGAAHRENHTKKTFFGFF